MDHASNMDGIAGIIENWEINPRKAGFVSSTPNNILHIESATILEKRLPILDTHYPPDALNAGCIQIFWLHSYQRRRPVEEVRAGLAPERRIEREDAMSDEPNHSDSDVSPKEALNSVWYVTAYLTGQPRRMGARNLDGDIGSGIAHANDQNVSLFQLIAIPVNVRVQL